MIQFRAALQLELSEPTLLTMRIKIRRHVGSYFGVYGESASVETNRAVHRTNELSSFEIPQKRTDIQ